MPKTLTFSLCAPALFASLVCSVFSSVRVVAQSPVIPADVEKISSLFDAPPANPMKCYLENWKPVLDFAFRFDAGYVITCRLGFFAGAKTDFLIYSRVTPEGKPARLFVDDFHLPEITRDRTGGTDPAKLRVDFTMSGAFGVGEGNYSVEILAIDNFNRSCHRRWKIHVVRERAQRNVPLSVKPLTVDSLEHNNWKSLTQRGKGIRLTVLLDAAPLDTYSSGLRTWDRAFLLESLYSLLHQMPCESVRVVAFNLEQQREIFRQESFGANSFDDLARTLRETETATVSVKALDKHNSQRFLATLANREAAAADAPDALILLGPKTQTYGESAASLLTPRTAGRPRVFYFQYIGWRDYNFRDVLQQLTKDLGGKIYEIHSPAQFGDAIGKTLAQLKQD